MNDARFLAFRPLRTVLAAAVIALLAPCAEGRGASAEAAHEDSPGPIAPRSTALDWRDQILYFAMIDRFEDGDPANNDQGAGVFDPADGAKYSGGDLRGITQRLDYIEGLGVTGLWITPPVANQWWDDEARFSGYHGYWASDFSAVDAHYGTLDDYVALGRALDGRGMALVQDIVVNHVGNFFAYDDWREGDPAHSWRRTRGSRPMDRPTQWPFSQNDPNDPAQRALSVYHWTPRLVDHSDEHQERSFQLAELDDLDTESPVVRRALRKSYGEWIRRAGVDAFRVDTAFYVPPEFFVDFMQAEDPEAPGVMHVAREVGKPGFHLFGEGWGIDAAYDDAQMRKIDAYQRVPGGLPAMIQFPLQAALNEVFARGHAPGELGWRIERTLAVHADPWRMPSFVDNHDVERFLASGDEAGLRQALLAMLTLPGIPVIYYGTEQGFTGQRDALFAGGFGSGGKDHFDTASPLYRDLARMVALRRGHTVLSRGTPKVLAANPAVPGVIAWTMRGDAEAERGGGAPSDDTLLVAMNTAAGEHLLVLDGLPPGARLQPLLALAGEAPVLSADAQGRVTRAVPAKAGWVWRVDRAMAAVLPADAASAPRASVQDSPSTPMSTAAKADAATPLTISPPPEGPVSGPLTLQGTAPPALGGRLRLIIDGDLSQARPLAVDAEGRWQLSVRTDDFLDARIAHTAQLFDPATGDTSAPVRFHAQPHWTLLAETTDPLDDDAGPAGTYRYPSGPSFAGDASMDVVALRLFGSGGALAIELAMADVLAKWNPAHGFDHVAFSLFFDVPGLQGGTDVMPRQNGMLPDGGRWQRRLRAGGWALALFGADGASATDEGAPISARARVSVDRERQVIRFELPASALGHPETLAGLGVRAHTWDYDGGWKLLEPAGSGHTMGGGDGQRDPLWMDAVELTVPVPLRPRDAGR